MTTNAHILTLTEDQAATLVSPPAEGHYAAEASTIGWSGQPRIVTHKGAVFTFTKTLYNREHEVVGWLFTCSHNSYYELTVFND